MALQIRRGLHADLPSSPADGELLYATDTKRLYVGLGGAAQNVELYNQSGMATNGFTGNGSTVAFAISNVITSKNNLLVFVEGVFQQQDAYSIATAGGVTTVTLDSAPSSGQSILIYSIVNAVSGTNLNNDTMTGDGSTTTMTLSIAPSHENNTQVYVDGVYQPKSTYSVSGTTLTFSQAPLNGSIVEAMTMNQTEVTSGSNFTVDSMTGDGSDATLTLSNAPASENNVQVYVDGVYQPKSTYSISGTTLTFSQAPLSGSSVEAISVTPTTINVPADGSVTSAKLSGDLSAPGALTVAGAFTSQGIDDNANTTAITIDSNEKVGIGVTSPDVSLDIGSRNDAIHVPVGTTAQRPGSPAAGYLRYNSTEGEFEGYSGSWGAIGGSSTSTFGVSTMTGDGSDTTLTLSADPGSENNTQVYIDGVYQPKSSYSVSGTTLTFSTAPPNNTSVEAIVGASASAGVPSDASVTSAKLSGALTTPSSLTLGGNLDVSGHDIVTVSNGAIDLDPNGSGVVTFKGNSTRGAGQFKLNCENNSHGITIKGPPHSASASYTLTLPNTDGNADQVLKTDGSGNLDWVDSGGGGMWAQVATSTISSEVHSIEFSSLGSYDEYEVRITGLEIGANSNSAYPVLGVIFDYGSGYVTSNYTYRSQYFPANGSQSFNGQNNTNDTYPEITTTRANTRSISSPYSPSFGKVVWTGAGSQFFSKMYYHKEDGDGAQAIAWKHLTASNTANYQTAPTKIKFVIVNGWTGNSLLTGSSEGMVAGKFTLYGRSAS